MRIVSTKKKYLYKTIDYAKAIDSIETHIRSEEKSSVLAMAQATHFLQSLLHKSGLQIPLLKTTCNKYLHQKWRTITDYIDFEIFGHGVNNEQLSMDFGDIPYPPLPYGEEFFTFIDLFAGIGGFRQAMQKWSGRCLFSSEWDINAQKTYFANYGEMPYGDINLIPPKQIPDHDILCGGFPCQPFSLAGVSKKNSLGRKHGFEDETQGTLFFNIAKIIKEKKPAAFFLENVKNLVRHDSGKTFSIIMNTLRDELGYIVNYKVVDGSNWVPQHRERIFIVGYNPAKVDIDSEDEITIPSNPLDSHYKRKELSTIVKDTVDDKYTLGPGTWDTLERHKAHHATAGNGFGYGIHSWPISKGTITRTISARYHKDGAEILIEQPGRRPRRLTVKEAMQLQGYDPDKFIFPVSATQAYHQIGNSVVVPAITDTAKVMIEFLKERRK